MTLIWANIEQARSETGCGDDYSLADLGILGARAEQDIQAELDLNALSTNPANITGSGVGMLAVAAQNWLCRNIRIEQKHDGTHPNSLSVGSDHEQVSIDASIKYYDDKGRDALDKYIKANTGTQDDVYGEEAGLIALAGEDL